MNLFSAASTAPGIFVTIDGPNGSGKTSLAAELAAALTSGGRTVHSTAQPSPTPLGRLVRASEATVQGRALACLVAADRHHQLASAIGPALSRGEVVVCDRYIESSLVLQRLDAVDVEFILAANAGILRPDIRIRLLADKGVLAERIAARGPDAARRFERANGPAAELRLYQEADELLAEAYGLASHTFDTTSTETGALGKAVLEVVAA